MRGHATYGVLILRPRFPHKLKYAGEEGTNTKLIICNIAVWHSLLLYRVEMVVSCQIPPGLMRIKQKQVGS